MLLLVVTQCIFVKRNFPIKYIHGGVFTSKSKSIVALALNPCLLVYKFL